MAYSYCQKHKEKLRKEARERFQNLSEEQKEKKHNKNLYEEQKQNLFHGWGTIRISETRSSSLLRLSGKSISGNSKFFATFAFHFLSLSNSNPFFILDILYLICLFAPSFPSCFNVQNWHNFVLKIYFPSNTAFSITKKIKCLVPEPLSLLLIISTCRKRKSQIWVGSYH